MQPPQTAAPQAAQEGWTIGAGNADIPEGTYPMILTKLGPIRKDVQTSFGAKDFRDWHFQIVGAGEYEDQEVRGSTSTSTGARSTAFKWLTVLLGREPQKQEQIPLEAITGRVVLGQVAHQNDWAKVVDIFPMPPALAAQLFSQQTGLAPQAPAPQAPPPAAYQPQTAAVPPYRAPTNTAPPVQLPQPTYQPPPFVMPSQPVPAAPVHPAQAPPAAPQQPQGPQGQPLREQVAGQPGQPGQPQDDLPF